MVSRSGDREATEGPRHNMEHNNSGPGCHAFAVEFRGSRPAGSCRESMTSPVGGHAFAVGFNWARRLQIRPRKHGTQAIFPSLRWDVGQNWGYKRYGCRGREDRDTT